MARIAPAPATAGTASGWFDKSRGPSARGSETPPPPSAVSLSPTGTRMNDSGRCGPVGPVTWDREAWRRPGHIARDLRTGPTWRRVGALNPSGRGRRAIWEREDEHGQRKQSWNLGAEWLELYLGGGSSVPAWLAAASTSGHRQWVFVWRTALITSL